MFLFLIFGKLARLITIKTTGTIMPHSEASTKSQILNGTVRQSTQLGPYWKTPASHTNWVRQDIYLVNM